MIDKAWVAAGFAVIVVPAIVYGEYLHRYVYRMMFRDELPLVLDEMADEARSRDAAGPHPNPPQGRP